MHSAMCFAHMGQEDYKKDIDAPKTEDASNEEDLDTSSYAFVMETISMSDEPLIIEMEEVEPIGYDEDGVAIYPTQYIN